MDILSLPKEMVVSILKYSEYSTVNKLRRINCSINTIVKSHDIGMKFPVTLIGLTNGECITSQNKCSCIYDIDLNLSAVSSNPNLVENDVYEIRNCFVQNNGSLLNCIDRLLKKVDLNGTLRMHGFRTKLDDQFLEVLTKNKKSLRNMSKFELRYSDIDCSKPSIRMFISTFEKLSHFHIKSKTITMENFFEAELFENRLWDSLSLRYYGEYSLIPFDTLNDDFLLKVVKNCKRCTIDLESNRRTMFTVNGIVELIKTLIEENNISDFVDLGCIHVHNSDFDEVGKMIGSVNRDVTCAFPLGTNSYAKDENGFLKQLTISDCTISSLPRRKKDFIQFTLCYNSDLDEFREPEELWDDGLEDRWVFD